MKRIFAFVFLSMFLYCSCKPEDDNDYVQPSKPIYNEIWVNSYILSDSNVNYVPLIAVSDSATTQFSVSVSLISGDPVNDSVTCYLSGLPAGMTVTADSGTFRLPGGLESTINVNVDTGIYQFNVNVNNRTKGLRSYLVRFHVLPVPDCATSFIGTWTSMNDCREGDSCTVTIAAITGMPHWARITNLDCLGDSVFADMQVSCSNGITIPIQSNHGYTIYGSTQLDLSGYYEFVTILDTVVHNGDTTRCTLHLQR